MQGSAMSGSEAGVAILRQRFRDRGYPLQLFDDLLARFTAADKVKKPNDSRPIVCLKLPFSRTTLKCGFPGIVRRHLQALDGIAGFRYNDCICDGNGSDTDMLDRTPWRFISCFTSVPNLFRRRYNRFLGVRACARGMDGGC